MSGAVKAVGKGLGSVAKFAAPIVSKIPGIGTFAAPLLAAGGNVLQGHNLQSTIQSGLGALNPFQIPGLGGILNGIGGGQNGTFGSVLQGLGVGSGLNAQTPLTGFNMGQSFLNGMGFGGQPGAGLPQGGFGGFGGFAQGGMGGGTGFPWGGSMPGGGQGFAPAAPAAPAAGGGSMLDSLLGFIKDPKNLALLGLGAGGAALATKSGLLDPRIVPDARNTATSDLSKLLSGALGGQLGDTLASGQLAGWNGPFGAGTTAGQQGDIDMVQQALQQFMGGNQGQDILDQLGGMAQGGQGLQLPPEIAALLGGGGGQGVLQGLAGGSDPISQLLAQLGGGQQTQGYDQAAGMLGQGQNAGMGALASLFGQQSPEQGMLQQLFGQAQNPFIQALAQSGQGRMPQAGQLQQLAGQAQNPFIQMLAQSGMGQNPALDQLLGFQSQSPERQLLLNAGQQNVVGGGQDMLAQAGQSLGAGQGALASLLGGGQGVDINQIGQMLNQARQPALQDDLNTLREQFSFNGLRNSTDLNQGASNLMARSQAGLTGQLAGLIPQLAGQSAQNQLGGLGALNQMAGTQGNLGQMAAQLGLGQQSNVLSAFGQAGQLGQGGLAQQLQALLGGGQLAQGQQGLAQSGLQAAGQQTTQQQDLISRILGQSGQLQLGQGQLAQGGLQGATSATTSQQDLLSRILGQAGQLGLGAGQQNLGAASQLAQTGQQELGQQRDLAGMLAQLGVTQQGQQGNILNQLLQTQLGAGQALQSGGTAQADILARLFGGQQNNALQAALAQPGALSQISQLPGILGQQAFNLAQGGQNNADTIIQRMIANSTQQQSLTPQILQFLGATPQQQVGDSLFSQLGGLLAAGAGLKASK